MNNNSKDIKTRRLKDKTWKCCTITIEKTVEQYKTGPMTENKELRWCLDISSPSGRRTSACFTDKVSLFCFIMREAWL